MKKLILILMFASLMQYSIAQNYIYKGRMMAGLSFNAYQQSNTNYDTTSNWGYNYNNSYSGIGGSLRFGLFVTEKVMVGLSAGYYNYHATSRSWNYGSSIPAASSKNLTNSYSFGLFSRYYKMFGNGRFGIFGQLGTYFGAGSGSQENDNPNQISTPTKVTSLERTQSFTLGLNAGLLYFLNAHFSIETTFGNLGYSQVKTNKYNSGKLYSEQKSGRVNSSLLFDLPNLYIGVNYYFGGKKPAAN